MPLTDAQKKAMSKYFQSEKGKKAVLRARLKRKEKIMQDPELQKKIKDYVTNYRILYLQTEKGREVHRNAMRKYLAKPENREKRKLLRQLRELKKITIH